MKERLHGIDLIRLISMVAIIWFHAHDMVFYSREFYPPADQSIFPWIGWPSRYISFSGFTVVALTSFLYGLFPPSPLKWKILLGILLGGNFVLALTSGDLAWGALFFEWDIFAFLLVSFLTLFLVHKHKALIFSLGLAGFALLWIPVWDLIDASAWPLWLQHAMLGVCDEQGRGIWPTLPWIGLVWLGFAAGTYARAKRDEGRALERFKMTKSELAVWASVLLATLPQLGIYKQTPLADGFACFVHRRPPVEFWSHIVWVVFLIRLSLDVRVNRWLSRFSSVRWASNLYWSRYFGVCYLLHLVYVSFGDVFNAWILGAGSMRRFDAFPLLAFPVVELSARALVAASKRFVLGSKHV